MKPFFFPFFEMKPTRSSNQQKIGSRKHLEVVLEYASATSANSDKTFESKGWIAPTLTVPFRGSGAGRASQLWNFGEEPTVISDN